MDELRHSFGSYRILGLLGNGGMGSVYLAQQTGPGGFLREVVLKLIRVEATMTEELRLMLVDEAQLTALISHPNVVTVYEVGEHAGELFIALERVRGVTLAALLRRANSHRLPAPIAAALLAQACDGLHAAHELHRHDGRPMNLIHRDVSQSNMMCDVEGRVRVIDFGIARAEGRHAGTDPAIVRGNLAYMAPEQIAGHGLDRTVDVYSTALVFYELCTGMHPFGRDRWRMAVPALRDLCPDVSDTVGDVVAASLALDPRKRPPTISLLGGALWEYARSHGCSGPAALVRHFTDHNTSLRPEPPRRVDPLAGSTTGDGPAGLRGPRLPPSRTRIVHTCPPAAIDLGQTLRCERSLPTGQRMVVSSTVVAADHRGRSLAMSKIEGLLLAPILITCTGSSVILHCEAAPGPSTARASFYVDANQPATRLERLLLDASSPPQSVDVGHRRHGVRRIDYIVARPGRDGLAVNTTQPPLQITAPADVEMLVALTVFQEETQTFHVECICTKRSSH